MNVITETKRLILREFKTSDAKDFYEINSDTEVLKYTGDTPFSSIKEAELFLKKYSDYEKNGFGRWAVVSKETNDYLGWCGLKLNEENFIDLGFRFYRKYWGKGYATVSAIASLAHGFNKLSIHEIIGRAAIENLASIRVLEKSGMKFLKSDTCNGIKNAVYYSISSTEFRYIFPSLVLANE